MFQLEEWIGRREGRCRQVVVTGFHGLWEAHCDAEFFGSSTGPTLGARRNAGSRCQGSGIRDARRVPGAELMDAFLAKADFTGYRSFFYGDTEETLSRLKAVAEERYPGHKVVGTLSPPFRPLSPEEDAEHLRQINAARPDILCWTGHAQAGPLIHAHLDRLEVPVAVEGAAFRFLTGQVQRAGLGRPARLRVGLSVGQELAVLRCSLIQGPQFTALVLMELLGLKKYRA